MFEDFHDSSFNSKTFAPVLRASEPAGTTRQTTAVLKQKEPLISIRDRRLFPDRLK
jgi:hypothetical protein